jgi:hypothetical protein
MQRQNRPCLRLEELERRDAPSSLGPDCHKINTSLEAHFTGPTSTAGVIQSGLLRGTTAFSGAFTDAQGDYVGTLVITTKHGTLTLQDRGHLNLATGEFTDQLTVSGGTGRFASATGALSDHGFANFQTGSLATDAFTGMICLTHGGKE